MDVLVENKMKNALVVCTVGCFLVFELNDISILQDMGYTVHVATNFNGYDEMYAKIKEMHVVIHQVDFARSPFKITNAIAYRQLKAVMGKNEYNLMHCHTPVGGVLARLAARPYRKKGMKVIYTAHGFHFFKGAPIKNWLLFYPIEKWLSRYTDVLITINHEDYERAKKQFYAKRVEYIPGVGVDVDAFSNVVDTKENIRKRLNIPENVFMLLSVGELNVNKNHQVVIKALAALKDERIHYYIAGEGAKEEYLRQLAEKLGVGKQVHLLGYRTDVAELLRASDIFIFPSKREGLSVALMEAMVLKLPIVASDIRGNRDLIDHEKSGYLFDVDSAHAELELGKYIRKLADSEQLGKNMGMQAYEKVKEFGMNVVNGKMRKIYTCLWETA